MGQSEDQSTNWLPIGEAAPLLGLTVYGLRSRIRRGLVTAKKGNDGKLLVPVPVDRPTSSPIDIAADSSGAAREPTHELLDELLELRVELARAQERQASAERREATLERRVEDGRTELDRERAAVERERQRADRLEAAIVELRRPWLARMLDALRRRHGP